MKHYKTHLFRGKDGNVVFINESRFLFNYLGDPLLLQLLAGQPKQNVLFRVLALEEVAKNLPSAVALHQLVEGLAPTPNLIQRWPTGKVKIIMQMREKMEWVGGENEFEIDGSGRERRKLYNLLSIKVTGL